MKLYEKFWMLKMNSGWIENAHSYLINIVYFLLWRLIPLEPFPCQYVTFSGAISNHCCCQPADHYSSQHTDPREHQDAPLSAGLYNVAWAMWEAPNTPASSGSNLAAWGGCQDNTRRGARGAVCQSQQVAMANSSSERQISVSSS
jgi:hypothetical protein